jgi:hypothetical protein
MNASGRLITVRTFENPLPSELGDESVYHTDAHVFGTCATLQRASCCSTAIMAASCHSFKTPLSLNEFNQDCCAHENAILLLQYERAALVDSGNCFEMLPAEPTNCKRWCADSKSSSFPLQDEHATLIVPIDIVSFSCRRGTA